MNKALVYILVVVAAAGWIFAWKTGQALEEERILRDNYVKSSAQTEASLAFEQGHFFFFEGPGSNSSEAMVDGKPLDVRKNPHQEATKDLFASEFNAAMEARLSRARKMAEFGGNAPAEAPAESVDSE